MSYFTAAWNEGSAFYEGAFDPVPTHLLGHPKRTVAANRFDNNTPYQTITATGGERLAIDIQWDAAYPSGGVGVPDSLVADLYDMQGNLIATSHQLKLGGAKIPEIEIDLRTPSAEYTKYQLAIYQPDKTPRVGQFIYTLNGTVDGASQAGGYVDDPNAEIGAGTTYGHDLVPEANTVGAADWSNSPTFGTPYFAEQFSSGGPGELLFDRHGHRLAKPIDEGKVDFLAPDGTSVATPGYQDFLGTSAAAPNAAAVAALMLQANPDLSPQQVTGLLKASAVSFGLSASEQGSGLIQAPRAVMAAQELASWRAFRSDEAGVVHIGASGQTVAVQPFLNVDNHREVGTTFVFDPRDGRDVLRGFLAGSAGHDTLDLPRSDFRSIADVLHHTADIGGGAVITDPVTGDAVRLAGVTSTELKVHRADIALHV